MGPRIFLYPDIWPLFIWPRSAFYMFGRPLGPMCPGPEQVSSGVMTNVNRGGIWLSLCHYLTLSFIITCHQRFFEAAVILKQLRLHGLRGSTKTTSLFKGRNEQMLKRRTAPSEETSDPCRPRNPTITRWGSQSMWPTSTKLSQRLATSMARTALGNPRPEGFGTFWNFGTFVSRRMQSETKRDEISSQIDSRHHFDPLTVPGVQWYPGFSTSTGCGGRHHHCFWLHKAGDFAIDFAVWHQDFDLIYIKVCADSIGIFFLKIHPKWSK